MSRDDADTLLSVAQAATLLGVHPNTIRIWTDAGRLTAYRINARGDRRFRRADVERLLVDDRASDEASLGDGRADQARVGELAAFGRIAAGLASSPTTASVARAVVEALRTEAGVRSAAVYLLRGEVTELAAHAGFVTPPPAARPRREVRRAALRNVLAFVGLDGRHGGLQRAPPRPRPARAPARASPPIGDEGA